MASSKRPADDFVADVTTKRLRPSAQERPESVFTKEVLRQFSVLYKAEFEFDELVMLCAYLCAILCWGYRINAKRLDQFLLLHSKYTTDLPTYEEEQCSAVKWCIPAYHQWFTIEIEKPDNAETTCHQILNETALRRIGKENPCTFEIAALTIDYVQATRPEEV